MALAESAGVPNGSPSTGRREICVVTSSFPLHRNDSTAAAGLFVRDFCLALSELGHGVTVVTPDKKGGGEREKLPGVDVHWFPWAGGTKPLAAMKPYNPLDALAMVSLFRNGAKTLERLAREKSFDHVMAMWAVPAGYLALGLKRKSGIPFTTWCLGSDIWIYGRYPILKGVVRKVLRESDLIYADGLKLAEDAERLSGRPCPFLPSSRRLDRSLARPLELEPGFRFLFIGRYAEVKGVDVLLEAMASYAAEMGEGHLYMFGGGPMEAYVRERAARADLKGRVTVGGYADEGTVVSYLAACDCLVIPSRMESIPVVLSDALQMGRPVIVSDVGDMGRVVRDQDAGIVVPAEDVDGLDHGMKMVVDRGIGEFSDAVENAARFFDVKRTAESWVDRWCRE